MTVSTKNGVQRDMKRPDYPYTMRLPDGRTVYVELPGRFVAADRSGETVFLPPAVQLLDHLKVLAMSLTNRIPTPGHIKTLRTALDLTQQQFAERVGVNKMTVARWEWGAVRPGRRTIKAIERLRKEAGRRGVTLPAPDAS